METEYIKVGGELVKHQAQNLTKRVESVKQDVRKYLTKEQINTRLQTITNHVERMFILILFRTGIRVTEAISIKKGDIDFKENTIKVRWQKSRKYLNRVVPVQQNVIELLTVYTAALTNDTLIFPFSRQRGWQICVKWFGKGISPHSFRHSFAVNWLQQGGDIVILHKILGHSKIQTTMEYLKIVPVDQAKELNKITF